MSKHIDQLNKHLTEYLSTLKEQRDRIENLETERLKLKRDVTKLRSQMKKAREDKQACLTEIKILKDQLKEVQA